MFRSAIPSLRAIFVGLVLLAGARAAQAQPTPDWQGEYVSPQAKAACAIAVTRPIPEEDQPTAAERAAMKCDSQALYYGPDYGSGIARDYSAARKCAFIERDTSRDSNPFDVHGSAVLAMIYANGLGVPRNLDLAARFVCEAGGAPAEIEGRLEHLEEIRNKPVDQPLKSCRQEGYWPPDFCAGKFDFCDDVTSGAMEGVCASIASGAAEVKRQQRINDLTRNWPPEHQKAFKPLLNAAWDYFDACGVIDSDFGGSARVAEGIDTRDKLRDGFVDAVKKFENGYRTHFSAGDRGQADKTLKRLYALARKKAKQQDLPVSASLPDDLPVAQRAWLAYREAWLRFARLRYPDMSADSLAAELTRERIKLLQDSVIDQ